MDERGLTATNSVTVDLPSWCCYSPTSRRHHDARKLDLGVRDVGAEYINECGGLHYSASNALGFVRVFRRNSVDIGFVRGEYNARESHFKDVLNGGNDWNWVDNVDML